MDIVKADEATGLEEAVGGFQDRVYGEFRKAAGGGEQGSCDESQPPPAPESGETPTPPPAPSASTSKSTNSPGVLELQKVCAELSLPDPLTYNPSSAASLQR